MGDQRLTPVLHLDSSRPGLSILLSEVALPVLSSLHPQITGNQRLHQDHTIGHRETRPRQEADLAPQVRGGRISDLMSPLS